MSENIKPRAKAAEMAARRAALELAAMQGLTTVEASEKLGIPIKAVRNWQYERKLDGLPRLKDGRGSAKVRAKHAEAARKRHRQGGSLVYREMLKGLAAKRQTLSSESFVESLTDRQAAIYDEGTKHGLDRLTALAAALDMTGASIPVFCSQFPELEKAMYRALDHRGPAHADITTSLPEDQVVLESKQAVISAAVFEEITRQMERVPRDGTIPGVAPEDASAATSITAPTTVVDQQIPQIDLTQGGATDSADSDYD